MATSTYYTSERREILPFLPAKIERLLDIGCSQGGFGAAVRALHPQAEVWGVEPVEEAASVAATRLTRVVHGLFGDTLDLPDGHFDVITFNDSLEHMSDERAALRLARRKLRPGGVVVCSVPNVRFLENLRQLIVEADWQYTESGVLDRTHLRFFTKKSIQRTFTEAGFAVKRIEGINSHWWCGWKVRLLRLVFRHHMDDTRWQQFVLVASL